MEQSADDMKLPCPQVVVFDSEVDIELLRIQVAANEAMAAAAQSGPVACAQVCSLHQRGMHRSSLACQGAALEALGRSPPLRRCMFLFIYWDEGAPCEMWGFPCRLSQSWW